eukprot:g4063.t1
MERDGRKGQGGGKKSDKANWRGRHNQNEGGTGDIFMQPKGYRRGGGGRENGGRGGGGGGGGGGRGGRKKKKSNKYPEHLKKEIWTDKVNDGELFVGPLRIASKSFNSAFVKPKGFKMDVFVYGLIARNRALDGDVVVIEILPEDKWNEIKTPGEDVTSSMGGMSLGGDGGLWDVQFDPPTPPGSDEEDDDDSKKSAMEKAVSRINARAKKLGRQPTGTVVAVQDFGRTWTREHMGHIEYRQKTDSYGKFVPHDKRLPWMFAPALHLPDQIRNNPKGDAANQIYLAKIDFDWPASSQMPKIEGGTVHSIGESGCIGPETRALLLNNDVDHGEFPEDVMEDLKKFMPDEDATGDGEKVADDDDGDDEKVDLGTHAQETAWKIPEDEIKRRRDMRKHRIFTIDPTTAKDLDDALHITKIDKDVYEIGVHIADVSYFVAPGTALDREAGYRCTSVYLVGRVIPMLPPLLCEKLCSLNPSVDRLAFSCIWRMHADGTMVKGFRPWYGRTVIRSCCKLDYGTAQKMIDGTIPVGSKGSDVSDGDWEKERRPTDGHTVSQVIDDVRALAKVGLARRKKRFESGSIRLDKVKLSFTLDPKTGNPCGMRAYPIKQSNNLVEEYMLLANFLVAQRLLQAYGAGGPALIRNHPPPAPKPLEQCRKDCAENGHVLRTGSAKNLQESLDALKKRHGENSLVYHTIVNMLMAPFKEAQYVCAGGSKSSAAWRHYALAIPYYTHFTSPIRRYADVLVHRLLFAALQQPAGQKIEDNIKASGYDVDSIAEACGRCNEKKRAAKEASMRSDEVFLCVYIKELGTPINADGVVKDVGTKSFTVLLPALGIEKRLLLTEAFQGATITDTVHDETDRTLTVSYRDGSERTRKVILKPFVPLKCAIGAKLSPPPCTYTVRICSVGNERGGGACSGGGNKAGK